MRTVVFHDEAEEDLINQVEYLISKEAYTAALELETIVQHFLVHTLAEYPLIGHPIGNDIFECKVPGSRIIIWYMFTETELQIIDIWHSSQRRS